jgi:intein/homing endonuclease
MNKEVIEMNVGKIYKLPINNKTAYIAGVIIGDGNISNSKKSKTDHSKDYRITIEMIDKEFLETFSKLIKSLITTKSKVKCRLRDTKDKPHYSFQFRNKSFYYFLVNDLEIPAGKKSNIVQIPHKLLSSMKLQKHFLAGLFDTDGGIRSNTLGFTSASQQLMKDTSKILSTFRIKHNLESWLNKKYSTYYYGLRISLKDTDRFLNEFPIKNKNKLKKCFHHVDVPEG